VSSSPTYFTTYKCSVILGRHIYPCRSLYFSQNLAGDFQAQLLLPTFTELTVHPDVAQMTALTAKAHTPISNLYLGVKPSQDHAQWSFLTGYMSLGHTEKESRWRWEKLKKLGSICLHTLFTSACSHHPDHTPKAGLYLASSGSLPATPQQHSADTRCQIHHEASLLPSKSYYPRIIPTASELQESLPVRKGRSSLRVLSTPRAKAMVDSFLMLLRRS
jgi:hypothetical protein